MRDFLYIVSTLDTQRSKLTISVAIGCYRDIYSLIPRPLLIGCSKVIKTGEGLGMRPDIQGPLLMLWGSRNTIFVLL